VVNHLTWIDPMSGMVIEDAADAGSGSAAAPQPRQPGNRMARQFRNNVLRVPRSA
jgi:hypothetical protein